MMFQGAMHSLGSADDRFTCWADVEFEPQNMPAQQWDQQWAMDATLHGMQAASMLTASDTCLSQLPGDADDASGVQLRGLPYQATVEDIMVFLRSHVENLRAGSSSIQFVPRGDGRPSGFARVQFNSPAAAVACCNELHNCRLDERYVETFLCTDRRKKWPRNFQDCSRSFGGLPLPNCSTTGGAFRSTCEQVVNECRDFMQQAGHSRLLLSCLGAALSNDARAFVKDAYQGLKQFLALFPNEFAVEGVKGSEHVTYLLTVSGLQPGTPPRGMQFPDCNSVTPPKWPQALDSNVNGDFQVQWVCCSTFPAPISAGAAPCGEAAATAAWVFPACWPGLPFSTMDQVSLGEREICSDLCPKNHPFSNFAGAGDGQSVDCNAHIAAVRLRGLPFDAQEQDVYAFFALHDVGNRMAGCFPVKMLKKANGRPSGQAVVTMASRRDADAAQAALNGQWMGKRYVEVFAYGEDSDTASTSCESCQKDQREPEQEQEPGQEPEEEEQLDALPPPAVPLGLSRENSVCHAKVISMDTQVLRERQVQVETSSDDEEEGFGGHLLNLMSKNGHLQVKNTFINFEEEEDGDEENLTKLRRYRSA